MELQHPLDIDLIFLEESCKTSTSMLLPSGTTLSEEVDQAKLGSQTRATET